MTATELLLDVVAGLSFLAYGVASMVLGILVTGWYFQRNPHDTVLPNNILIYILCWFLSTALLVFTASY
jgi:hypothetical protein